MRAERNRKGISPALTRDRQMYVLSFPCLSCGVVLLTEEQKHASRTEQKRYLPRID